MKNSNNFAYELHYAVIYSNVTYVYEYSISYANQTMYVYIHLS